MSIIFWFEFASSYSYPAAMACSPGTPLIENLDRYQKDDESKSCEVVRGEGISGDESGKFEEIGTDLAQDDQRVVDAVGAEEDP